VAENAPKPPVTTVGAAVGFTNAAALSLAKLASASFSTRAAERDDDPLQRQTRREGSAVLSRFIKAIANMPSGLFGHKLGGVHARVAAHVDPVRTCFVLRGLSGSV
jgi:hypothetical protein